MSTGATSEECAEFMIRGCGTVDMGGPLRDLSICGLRYRQGSWNQSPEDTKG